jgi:hypothetical protein
MRGSTWFFGVLGTIFSMIALTSLCARIFHAGLIPVASDVIDAYRAVVHPIMGWMLGWVRWIFPNWTVPDWLKDLYSLSFVGAFGYARGFVALDSPEQATQRLTRLTWMFGLGFILGATFLGLLQLCWAPVPLLMSLDKSRFPNVTSESRIVHAYMLGALGGTILFFALNYGALHDWNWKSVLG